MGDDGDGGMYSCGTAEIVKFYDYDTPFYRLVCVAGRDGSL